MRSPEMPTDEGLLFKIRLSVEEVVENIVRYAYENGLGWLETNVERNPKTTLTIILKDAGVPFNPLAKEDPDITLSAEEREKMIEKNPDYGVIVCNCEKISLGEIKDEFESSVPPKTIKAVKKRTRAGFGKCQGGFCQPIVTRLIAEKFNIPLNKVMFQKSDSFVVRYEVKGDHKDEK